MQGSAVTHTSVDMLGVGSRRLVTILPCSFFPPALGSPDASVKCLANGRIAIRMLSLRSTK